MKKNQKGFSAIEVILVLVIVGLVGFLGWYVWQKQNENKPVTKESSTAKTTTSNNKSDDKNAKIDTSITDVKINLKTQDDINKLPSNTPASFKTYLLEKLKNNTPDADGCVELYSISKISAVNIVGGGSAVSGSDSAETSCVGGAPRIWVLAPNGIWDDVTLNGPVCKSENGGLVYEEFVAECIADPNTGELVKNPNGSITSLAQ